MGDQGEAMGIESRTLQTLGIYYSTVEPDLLLVCAYDICAGTAWGGTQVTVHMSEDNFVESVFFPWALRIELK